jgi:flagellar basal-body rod protein FlgG
MLRSLYTAATGMDAQQLKLDVISNNLANASTTGYKKARAEFADLLADTIKGAGAPSPSGGSSPAPLQVGLGVQTGTTTRSFGQGDLTTTQNPTDVAIQGSGFFRVQLPSGEPGYTRAGNFSIDATGRLVTQHGEVVDPGITIPAGSTNLTILPDGTVTAVPPGSTDASELGRIDIYTFTNPGGLTAMGNNIFVQSPGSGEAQQARPGEQGAGSLAQGVLEGANVRAVEEMIEMIAAQRAYELNSKVIQSADQMLQRLTSLR